MIRFLISTRVRNIVFVVTIFLIASSVAVFALVLFWMGIIPPFWTDTTLRLMAMVIGGEVVAAFLLVSWALWPFVVIIRAARDIEGGNTQARANVKTHNEFGELALLINKLAHSAKLLEDLKKEFVFIAAHELRAPITAIRGHVYLASKGDAVPEHVKEALLQIDKASQHLAEIINDYIEAAQGDEGGVKIEVAAIDIQPPIRAVMEEMKPQADEKHIGVTYETFGATPLIMGNTERVKEVMMNLVGNAIKYTPNGGSITISHEVVQNELVTHIKDTGIGISHEAQKKLFEKFSRVKNEKTRGIKGTGLGLFIVKQILEKMGGSVWVESEDDKGSTFSFSLPLAREDDKS